MKPKWFEELLKSTQGRDLSKYRLLDTLYNQTQSIKHDRFDTVNFESIRKQALELDNITHERDEDPTWPSLIRDTYWALWKAAPKLIETSGMKSSYLLNQAVMERVLGAKQYAELRSWTELDDWASVMGTISMVLKLNEFFDEQKDLRELQEKAQQQESGIEDLLNEAEDSDGDPDEFLDDLEKQLEDYEETTEHLQDSIASNQTAMKSATQQAIEEARDEAEQTAGIVQSFGTDPGQWDRLDPVTRMKLSDRLHKNRTLLEIAKMIGRMKRLAIGRWSQRVIHGVDEVYDLQLGNDLSRIVPSELIYLADDELQDIFWAKYASHSLLESKLRGSEKTSQGAIIALLDNSGSMHGKREIWGKAICLSLLEIAKREHRDFYGIHFSSSSEIKEWYFPKGECELSDVVDYAEWFSGGGTDFEAPLSRGVEVLEQQFNSDGSQKGDLIMITDGECWISDTWLASYTNAKKDLAFRTYGILINDYGSAAAFPALDSVCDQVWTVKDIATGGDVRDMWSMI